MKKIVVWSWRYVVAFSAFLLFLVFWCAFAYFHGYADTLSFWLFFPLIITVFGLLLTWQFTVIAIQDQQLLVYRLGKLRKQTFKTIQINLSYGIKVKPSPKAMSMYPIDIFEIRSGKNCRIICGSIRGLAFEQFWKEYKDTELH